MGDFTEGFAGRVLVVAAERERLEGLRPLVPREGLRKSGKRMVSWDCTVQTPPFRW